MKRFKRFWKKLKSVLTPARVIIGFIVLATVLWLILKPAELLPRYTIDKGVVERVVIASGKVEVSDQVNLGFQQSGTVSSVLVKSGSRIRKGQLIARLDIGTLSADLRDARAGLTEAQFKKSRSQLESSLSSDQLGTDTVNASANLEALRVKLLSSDLELSPDGVSVNSSAVAPSVSGTYTGRGEKAVFSFSLYGASGGSGLAARVMGEGINDTIGLATSYPSAIGATGLFIQLPINSGGLTETKWRLELPNTRSAQYSSNLYQFLEAKKNYETTLKSQSKEISLITKGYSGYTEYDIAIERAQAGIDRVNQSIRLRGLYAPVSGTIGRIDLKLGQTVTQGVDVVTVLGRGKLETKLKVPESSIGGIQSNDVVTIVPDIDAGDIYTGVIASINQSETNIEGTPVYETTVVIDNPKNLKPGMTVRGKITTDKRVDVVRLPDLALFIGAEGIQVVKKFIEKGSNTTTDVPIKILLKGTDGFVAVEGAIGRGDEVQLQELKK